jgi:hypothetical protein
VERSKQPFETATLLDGLTVICTLNGKVATRFEHWTGKLHEFAKHLCTWGDAGTVKFKTVGMTKVQDRGVPCMMVGYALNHPSDTTYCLFNMKQTGGIHESREHHLVATIVLCNILESKQRDAD